MTKLRYKIQKALFRFVGDIRWHGILHPFWFTINAKTTMLKGKHYRKVSKVIQPGDIIIRRFEGYVDKWFIPGWYNHAGIYVGEIDGEKHQVIHAISDGVIVEDLIDFMKTDHMIVLRANESLVDHAIKTAKSLVGKEYDFAFDFGDNSKFSCTELVNFCYGKIFKGEKRFGRYTLVADDIVYGDCSLTSVVWHSITKRGR